MTRYDDFLLNPIFWRYALVKLATEPTLSSQRQPALSYLHTFVKSCYAIMKLTV